MVVKGEQRSLGKNVTAGALVSVAVNDIHDTKTVFIRSLDYAAKIQNLSGNRSITR